MLREISSGGVVVRHKDGAWWVAVIEPRGDSIPKAPKVDPAKRAGRAKEKTVLCLPKGLVDPGEKALEAAMREVKEETGITASLITKLADIKYMYVRSWSDGERVFKIVSFYLFRYESGRIDQISEDMRIEVAVAQWVPLADAPKLLAYKGEKQMARQALEYVNAHPELAADAG
ncbi:MAG TPA: NUDIX domain-containing protein [Candidatus Eisenbacteria bacterium]|nr:NUDIX domain-containing protein [Candidatus Eisenbacteria bacterium]